MPLLCPQCEQVYEHQNICPLCNVVLLFHAQNLQAEPSSVHLVEEPPQWQQTPWGKILIGLVLAQGLSQGLRQLLTAGFLAGWDSSDVWTTLYGLVLLHSVQVISLLLGGAITGAGQSRGIIYGALVGLTNGILTLVLSNRMTEFSMLVLGEPLLHLVIGGLGGALGMLIWRPAPKIPELESTTETPPPRPSPVDTFGHLFIGPIHMGRVSAGALLVVVGVVWSKAILDFLLRASQGTLTISSSLQAQLVSLELSALFALLGATFAGATTRNGLKQGLFVGMIACVGVLGLQISNPKIVLESMVFMLIGVLILTLVGGWFGAQLFPPILPGGKRRRSLAYYS